jgi:hypothetical protein
VALVMRGLFELNRRPATRLDQACSRGLTIVTKCITVEQ